MEENWKLLKSPVLQEKKNLCCSYFSFSLAMTKSFWQAASNIGIFLFITVITVDLFNFAFLWNQIAIKIRYLGAVKFLY